MEDLERLVAGRLRALDEAAPSPEARDRILGDVRRTVTTRRRRRRALQSAAGASLVAVAVVAAPVLLGGAGEPGHDSPEPAPLAATAQRPTAENEKEGTGKAGNPPRTRTKPPVKAGTAGGTLPGGMVLSAFGVASDGAVLGEGRTGSDSDGTLWRADLNDLLAAPVPVTRSEGLTGASGGDALTVWAEETGSGVEVLCQDGDGTTISLGGGLDEDHGYHADGAYAVWTDDAGTVWSAKGCDAAPRQLAEGYAAGFAYPYAYVLATGAGGAPTGELSRLHVETGAGETHDVPAGLLAGDDVMYAAGKGTFSIAHGSALTVFDTSTWARRTLGKRLPAAGGSGHSFLTAGDDLIVYSSRAASAKSLIYDVNATRAKTVQGEAFTKGPWLLTRTDPADDYALKPSG
ncbi:hypothetical protein [Actinocorallia longicatena]|uniref:Pyrroloquinoline-quinone binding quinoprotein n=1 Tax=Actinocorallia longicatena TaxID=111803 RepID=A0ABP6QMX0_9ACTN